MGSGHAPPKCPRKEHLCVQCQEAWQESDGREGLAEEHTEYRNCDYTQSFGPETASAWHIVSPQKMARGIKPESQEPQEMGRG